MIRCWVFVLVGMLAVPRFAVAHDVLNAAAMEDFLGRLDSHRAIADEAGREGQAEAFFQRGMVLSESVDLLNQDYMVHAGSHGTVAEVYLRELAARGFTLTLSPKLGRYPVPVGSLECYLALTGGGGDHAAEALHEVITARFYDSFVADPFAPLAGDWTSVRRAIADGERFLARFPAHPDLAEIRFVLAVNYGRAALLAPDEAERSRYREAAAAGLADYAAAYPQSMRAAAAEALIARLDAD
ncbi:MAG: hypothetical protein CMM50_05190 [Rhodospirillaceae bacterium]|nr:hypothetical protein [Rhodospirillaceae bacterium]